MSTIAFPLALRGHPSRAWRHWPALGVLVACAAFMFLDLRTPPVVLWDESRIAVNALEMHLSGHPSLVSTYGFGPDLWNTKPPLLIWLIDLSMSLFGVSEGAIRFPSMLAAMGTLALTLSFARRLSGSVWTGALAAGMLATSIVFFGEHGARTADYEALLGLFTTGYLYVLFFALHRRRPGWGRALLAGGLIGAAVMTKSVAGLMPGLGAPLYLLLVGRWRRPLQPCWLMGAAPLALGPATAFYALREAAAPGYLHAVLHNDLSGRYVRALDRHAGPPWYYLEELFRFGGFSAGWLGAAAPAGVPLARGRMRLGLIYSLCVCAALLGATGVGATKLLHYAAPAAPFLAIATALALQSVWTALAAAVGDRGLGRVARCLAIGLVAGLLAFDAGVSVYFRASYLPRSEFKDQALYGALLDGLAARGAEPIRVVDGGVVSAGVEADGVPPDYAPQLDYYRELAVARGQDVARIAPRDLASQPRGALLASCDPSLLASLRALGPDLAGLPGCAAVRR